MPSRTDDGCGCGVRVGGERERSKAAIRIGRARVENRVMKIGRTISCDDNIFYDERGAVFYSFL